MYIFFILILVMLLQALTGSEVASGPSHASELEAVQKLCQRQQLEIERLKQTVATLTEFFTGGLLLEELQQEEVSPINLAR